MRNLLYAGLTVLLCIGTFMARAQSFVPLWNHNMPNSKGIEVKDSIANERAYQVGNPGIYLFRPSKAENKAAAVLIIPGGGYARLAYEISGFQLAKWFNSFGVTAAVLFHRMPQSPDVEVSYKAPLQDGQRAIRYLRAHARELGLNSDCIGVMGSSAGAHLSACLSVIQDDWSQVGDSLDKFSIRPDFSILVSPVISMYEYAHRGSRDNLLGKNAPKELLDKFSCDKQVTAQTPPAFMVHATNDPSVSPMNSILYYTALKEQKVAGCSIHIFPEGGHSIALRNNPGSTAQWVYLAEAWMQEMGWLK